MVLVWVLASGCPCFVLFSSCLLHCPFLFVSSVFFILPSIFHHFKLQILFALCIISVFSCCFHVRLLGYLTFMTMLAQLTTVFLLFNAISQLVNMHCFVDSLCDDMW